MKNPSLWLLILSTGLAFAQGNRNFPVQFQNCVEYVGTGPIPLAQAQAFVPSPFVIATDTAGDATFVVRAARCASVKVDGFDAMPGIVSHIGVSVISPDGTGDINNYTVAYATDSERLAQRLERAGIPALVDPDLVKEDNTSSLYVEVSPNDKAGWSITGTQTNTAFLTIPFLANWWSKGEKGIVKMATNIPSITFKFAQGTIITRRSGKIGQLIQGNSYSQFGARLFDFNVRGEFVSGLMDVIVR